MDKDCTCANTTFSSELSMTMHQLFFRVAYNVTSLLGVAVASEHKSARKHPRLNFAHRAFFVSLSQPVVIRLSRQSS